VEKNQMCAPLARQLYRAVAGSVAATAKIGWKQNRSRGHIDATYQQWSANQGTCRRVFAGRTEMFFGKDSLAVAKQTDIMA
jgi:hypothetical protein